MKADNRRLTIETLEQMFVYLGCANIPTQEAMDGAIPIESLLDARQCHDVSCFEPAKLASMPAAWATKAVWFSGDHLGLSTAQNIHWSAMAREVQRMMTALELTGYDRRRKRLNEECDGYVRLLYSEIDRFGNFVKFPISKEYRGPIAVKKVFNPDWILAFASEKMWCVRSSSDSLYESKRLSFLTPFLCGLAQSLGSYWLVKTRFDSVCPSLTLLTDPTGVKEFWKLRDVPPGRSRRAALLHWVENHWRQMRSDPDVETFVRRHMRGQSEIRQGSFEAVVTPSERDTVDAEIAKAEREAMRRRKEDRRRRKRIIAGVAR